VHQTRRKQLLAGGIFQILVGVAAIVIGFTAGEFYPAFMRRPRPDEKPVPKWLGRTVFVVVGIGFILSGLADVRHH
jgi:putative Mn2+ efflux pump MntP